MLHSKENEILTDKEIIIEEKIKKKLTPIMMKYINKKDYEGAKKFIGNSYQDLNTSGKVLLFRTILLYQEDKI